MTQTILLLLTPRASWLKEQGVKNPSKAITDDIITGDSNLFSERYKSNLQRKPKSCHIANKSTPKYKRTKPISSLFVPYQDELVLLESRSVFELFWNQMFIKAPLFSVYLESNHNLAVYFRFAPICAGNTWKIGNFTGWAADPSTVAKGELIWTCLDVEYMPENKWNLVRHNSKTISHSFWPWKCKFIWISLINIHTPSTANISVPVTKDPCQVMFSGVNELMSHSYLCSTSWK